MTPQRSAVTRRAAQRQGPFRGRAPSCPFSSGGGRVAECHLQAAGSEGNSTEDEHLPFPCSPRVHFSKTEGRLSRVLWGQKGEGAV